MAANDQDIPILQRLQNEERRAFERACVLIPAQMSVSADSGLITNCVVFDLSANGAKIRINRFLADAPIKQLSLFGFANYDVELAWNHGDFAGLQFSASPEYVAETLAGFLPIRCLEL